MNYKIIKLYGNTKEPDAFYLFYRNKMIPKKLKKICVNILSNSPMAPSQSSKGTQYSVMGELYVKDVERFMKSFRESEAGQLITNFPAKKQERFLHSILPLKEPLKSRC